MSCARKRLAKDDVALPEGLTMNDWRDYELTIGMPHMVPNRLSEVELLKCLGAFQWASIATKLGRQSRAIVNVQDSSGSTLRSSTSSSRFRRNAASIPSKRAPRSDYETA